MQRKTKIQLAVLVVLAAAGMVPMIVTGEVSFVLAYLATLGALVGGALGTYSTLDATGRPVERPGAIRAALLGDGSSAVSRTRWGTFQALRLSGLALLVGGFAFAMSSSLVAWKESAARDLEVHQLRQTVDLLMHQENVPAPVQRAYDQSRVPIPRASR